VDFFFIIYTCNHRELIKVAYLWQTVVIHTKYCSYDQIKKILISGACETYWGGMRSLQGFDRETGRKDTIEKNN
jgi:hypothetical protein